MRLVLAVVLILTLGFASCDDKPSANTLEGVIIDIDSKAIDDVNGFTLKDGEKTYEILIDDEVDYGFPLGHLQEHVQSSAPVRVGTVMRDGDLYARSIKDI